MPNTQSQFKAIQQEAQGNSLVNRLFANKRGAIASASQVKSPNMATATPTPYTPPVRPQAPQMQANTPPPPALPVAPVNQPIQSHTVTNPDGSVVKQTYHKPEENKPAEPTKATPSHEIKMINNMHHLPFKKADGSVGYINANGEIM